jgi:hypothetical protein
MRDSRWCAPPQALECFAIPADVRRTANHFGLTLAPMALHFLLHTMRGPNEAG